MSDPIIYGPAYSTYARSVRLALEEKGVPYKLEAVDIIQGAGNAADHLRRQPFAKVPAFEHDGFALYETAAIERYVDESFPGPKLQPQDPKQRARMTQIVSVIDSYAYPALIGKCVWQRMVMPMIGQATDEGVIAEALPKIETSVAALENLADPSGPYLCGTAPSLADLHVAPVMAYFSGTPEGQSLLAKSPKLSRWWQVMSARPSMAKTQPN
ncbi:MAG TPA: glutathione S-transferase family protein [Verrucomicrobiae bacterium]|nr:glutathione S-transferase family protein [Verrucomicrobiae bacterium]